MATPKVDPFDSTDADPIRVDGGLFSAEGPERIRLGSSNARLRSGGPFARWRGAAQSNRLQWTGALAILLVVGILLPALISFIGATQRASLEAEAASTGEPLVRLSPEVLAAQESARGLLGCYAMTSAFAPDDATAEMKAKLDAIDDSVRDDDPAATQRLVDEAREHFVDVYSLRLADHVEVLMGEWNQASWTADQEVYAAEESLRSHRSLEQFDALCADAVTLGSALGKVRDEDMESRTTWVPVPTVAPEPTPTESAPPTTEAPAPTTEAPEPEPEPEPEPDPDPSDDPEPTDEPGPTGGPRPQPTRDPDD
ncbi:MAG: hypothetical protein GXX90_07010 [Microbacteriaceae bacterium]|nr:hypothetical protein [Microbacteriaceae bacterium]